MQKVRCENKKRENRFPFRTLLPPLPAKLSIIRCGNFAIIERVHTGSTSTFKPPLTCRQEISRFDYFKRSFDLYNSKSFSIDFSVDFFSLHPANCYCRADRYCLTVIRP